MNQKNIFINNQITFQIIDSSNENFINICNYIEENINRENLRINGGTLQNSNITYKANFIIIACKNNLPIAYNSIRQKEEDELYVSQIAVKNEFKKMGIGTKMMEILIRIAKITNKNIKAHVRYYNTPSLEMFKSLGFIQSTGLTKKGSYTFTKNIKKELNNILEDNDSFTIENSKLK